MKDISRLHHFKNGIRQDRESVLLDFEDEMLLNEVTLG